MSDSSKFWIIINVVWALTTVMVVHSISTYWIDYDTQIVQLIETGISPAEAKCALEGEYLGASPACIIALTEKAAQLDETED